MKTDDTSFLCFVHHNLHIIANTLKDYNNVKKTLDERIKEFRDEQFEVIKKYGKQVENSWQIPKEDTEAQAKYAEDIQPIIEKHKEVLDKYDKDLAELMQKECEVKLESILASECPKEGLVDFIPYIQFLIKL